MPIRSKAQLGWLASHQKQIGGHQEFLKWLKDTPNIAKLPKKIKKEDKK